MRIAQFALPFPMHIPDGFLSVSVSIIFWVISIVVIGVALKKTSQNLDQRRLPLMGIVAAAIFAGQMLNFSVTGGTSGHLLGAALATILLGPWPAMVVMTSVVSVQALLFQDGGLLALGANLFNMAVIGVMVSYAVFQLLMRLFKNRSWGRMVSGFASAWASIFIASLCAALQLAISGTSPANIAIPAMAGIHALIGIGEGLITLGALAFLTAASRDLLAHSETDVRHNKGVLIGGSVIVLLLAVLSPLASSHPDGLEWVAEQHGFLQKASAAVFKILPDYMIGGITNPVISTIVAALIGTVVVFALVFGLGMLEKRHVAKDESRR